MSLALLASALALGGCFGTTGYELPTQTMKHLSPEMLALLKQKHMSKFAPILIRIFKEESELEVWKKDGTGRYALLKVYPICRWSGKLGPKIRAGDRQAPEGFYEITPGLMNPDSSYYLAINTGFPNTYDRANGRTGDFLMIHGDCSSRGCYAMTNKEIGEIYALARNAFLGGQKEFQIQAFPFRMTPANLARHRDNPNMPFWRMIKRGNDIFEVTHEAPKVDVCDRHYVFNAVPVRHSRRSLVFRPTGRCPRYQLDPTIAQAVHAKERQDNLVYAQLVKEDVPEASLDPRTDGGMNRVFIAKLDSETYTYDDKGHIHVPPQQPGQLPPAISPPAGSESETVAAVTEPPVQAGSLLHNVFSELFTSRAAAEPAAASAGQHSGFFGGPFATFHTGAAAPAAAAASPEPEAKTASGPKPTTREARKITARHARTPQGRHRRLSVAAARPKPKPQAPKLKLRQAEAAKPKIGIAPKAKLGTKSGTEPGAKPVRQVSVWPSPGENKSGLITSAQAQAATPTDATFNSRWAAFGNQ